jgi:guanine deaminase
MQASDERDLAMIAGKVLQDRHSPPALRDDTERSLLDSAALIRRWHGRGRLRYAITPRFAPTSTERQLAGAGELARAFPDVTVQSHVAENLDEIAWVGRLFPNDRSYLSVYDRFGLVRPRSLWGHCIHLDPDDRALLREREAVAAVCPTSNMFLGSGLFNFAAANHPWSLASDIGGGSSLSPFRTMMTAFEVARLGGHYLSPSMLWWHASTGSANALGLGDRLGRIQPGYDADWIVIDPQAKPLLARRWAQAETDDAKLFALIVLGDDRNIAETVVRGRGVPFPLEPGG